MYNLVELLRNIGLSEKEAIAYCTNLKIGTHPASTIARKAQINRCTAYAVLESLTKKGLVCQFIQNKVRYYTAVDPQQLVTYINEQKRNLSYHKEEILLSLPSFEALRHPHHVMPTVKSYSSKTGLTSIFHEVMKEKEIAIWTLSSQKQHIFFQRFASAFITSEKRIRLIRLCDNQHEQFEISTLKDLADLKACTPIQFIGENKAFICSTYQEYGIEIINKEIVQLLLKQFDAVWNK